MNIDVLHVATQVGIHLIGVVVEALVCGFAIVIGAIVILILKPVPAHAVGCLEQTEGEVLVGIGPCGLILNSKACTTLVVKVGVVDTLGIELGYEEGFI